MRARNAMSWSFVLLAWLGFVSLAVGGEDERYTYSAEYQVRVDEADPTVAHVRWKLAGIDEIVRLRLDLSRRRLYDVSGTGRLEQTGDELVWTPRAPYAHLEYKVPLRQFRGSKERYDSYAGDDWVITRAKALFPRTRVTFQTDIEPDPRGRTSLMFRLPRGWRAYAAMKRTGQHSFRPGSGGRVLERPKGWIALGKGLRVSKRRIGKTFVTVARAPGSRWEAEAALDLYEKTLPEMRRILLEVPERLLIVSGSDPMWRGGISGFQSFYVHGDRPLRTPDRTSPALHELFHIIAPFRPGADGEWITEGLAEYYSLELQHRVGALKERDFQRGLRLFARYGEWRTNLAAERSLAATNNSAPLVVHAIDLAIRKRTRNERSLDDVVRELSRSHEEVTTSGFLRAVNAVSGYNFTSFFQRHVYAGIPPELPGEADPRRQDDRKPAS